MIPVNTPRTDRDYRECGGTEVFPLPCWETDTGGLASAWELDDEERAAIAAGGQIALEMECNPPPPVGLTVVGPWCDEHEHEQVWSPDLKIWTCPQTEDTVEL